MNAKIFKLFFGTIFLIIISCKQTEKNTTTPIEITKEKTVMTQQQQEKLSPDEVLKDLLLGNERYKSNKLINRDLPKQVVATATGQYPKAVILACIDSRVPVEYIFDQGIGDIFVVRVAGNVEDVALLGSMEYGLKVAGAKLLMVLGHGHCGAVKSAIKKADVGSTNVTSLLNEIEPAIQEVEGKRDIKNEVYFEEVVKNNVNQTIADIRKRSTLINQLEKEGKIKVVGAYYNLEDGNVSLLEEETSVIASKK